MNSISMQQVHGNNVVRVFKKDIGKIIPECDGLITNDEDVILSVKTADCLPISIVDSKNKAVGVVHAGWRGLQKEIIKNVINHMIQSFGSNPLDLKIKIGPHICKKHYETDLIKVAKTQLISLGILDKNIKVSKKCTFENLNLPSYRRDKSEIRLLTIIKNVYNS